MLSEPIQAPVSPRPAPESGFRTVSGSDSAVSESGGARRASAHHSQSRGLVQDGRHRAFLPAICFLTITVWGLPFVGTADSGKDTATGIMEVPPSAGFGGAISAIIFVEVYDLIADFFKERRTRKIAELKAEMERRDAEIARLRAELEQTDADAH